MKEVNYVDQDRQTALFQAVSSGQTEVVRLLLADERTNPGITNRPAQISALDMADSLGFTEIAGLIRQRGKGSNALHPAIHMWKDIARRQGAPSSGSVPIAHCGEPEHLRRRAALREARDPGGFTLQLRLDGDDQGAGRRRVERRQPIIISKNQVWPLRARRSLRKPGHARLYCASTQAIAFSSMALSHRHLLTWSIPG